MSRAMAILPQYPLIYGKMGDFFYCHHSLLRKGLR
jgi:hypothetical protein